MVRMRGGGKPLELPDRRGRRIARWSGVLNRIGREIGLVNWHTSRIRRTGVLGLNSGMIRKRGWQTPICLAISVVYKVNATGTRVEPTVPSRRQWLRSVPRRLTCEMVHKISSTMTINARLYKRWKVIKGIWTRYRNFSRDLIL
jgi:hypothetical protein